MKHEPVKLGSRLHYALVLSGLAFVIALGLGAIIYFAGWDAFAV